MIWNGGEYYPVCNPFLHVETAENGHDVTGGKNSA